MPFELSWGIWRKLFLGKWSPGKFQAFCYYRVLMLSSKHGDSESRETLQSKVLRTCMSASYDLYEFS
jgi:hypothetical protein